MSREILEIHVAFLVTVPGSGGAEGTPRVPWAQLLLLGRAVPTSLAAGAHEPRRADAFTNVVMADTAVQTVRTVLLTGRSPFLRRAGCRESGGDTGLHSAGVGLRLLVIASWGAVSLLTSHDQAVEGTPERAVTHECGTVDPIFTHADVGECQGDEVTPHLTPVCGLVVGACKGAEGDSGSPCAPRASTRHWLGAASAPHLLSGPLAISFPHNVRLLPLEDPGREGGHLGDIHRLCDLHWEEVGCRGG